MGRPDDGALLVPYGDEQVGQVPLDPRVVEGGDTGRPIVVAEPRSGVARALDQLADRVLARVAERYPEGAEAGAR